jgi:multidrug efflux pump subunit AcrB
MSSTEISERIKQRLFETPGTIDVTDDWGPRIKKLYINLDDNKLSLAGLTNQDVAISLLTSLSGFDVGEFRDEDQSIPITMKRLESEELSYMISKTSTYSLKPKG